jgi:uncharacterized protein (DUF2267 family)
MSLNGLDVFDETIHKTNSWLKEIAQQLGLERRGAYQVLRAVLHCLRDRLTVNEAADLGDQLPMLVRGIYYEGWHPAGNPEKIRSLEDFLDAITSRLQPQQPVDTEDAARAVFRTLEHQVSAGEIRQVIDTLPKTIRALWPPLSEAAVR